MHQKREVGPRPLAWREAADQPPDIIGAQPELREQGARAGLEQPRLTAERVEQRRLLIERQPGLVYLADPHGSSERLGALGESDLAEQRPQQRGLARAVVAENEHPVAPAELHAHRAERERPAPDDGLGQHGDDVAAAGGGAEAKPQFPFLPRLGDRLEAFGRAQRGGSLSRLPLGASRHAMPDVLVGFLAPRGCALRGALARSRPFLLPPRPLDQLIARGRIGLIGLGRPGAVALKFGPIGLITAAVELDLTGMRVDLQYLTGGPFEERTVMGDDDEPAAEGRQVTLEQLEPTNDLDWAGLEQQDVELGEQHGSESKPGCLA